MTDPLDGVRGHDDCSFVWEGVQIREAKAGRTDGANRPKEQEAQAIT